MDILGQEFIYLVALYWEKTLLLFILLCLKFWFVTHLLRAHIILGKELVHFPATMPKISQLSVILASKDTMPSSILKVYFIHLPKLQPDTHKRKTKQTKKN